MKFVSGSEKLGLPDIYRFGVELEAFNVKVGTPIIDTKNSLYYSPESRSFLKDHRWKCASPFEESLVSEGGAEVVSPILYDKEEDWRNLQEVCDHVKKYPGSHGKEVVADSKCGCHVHFDARALEGRTPQETKQIMTNFQRLWAESEELIYKMCNDVNDPIREGTMSIKIKGFMGLMARLEGKKGMAIPTGKKILKQIENGTLKVSNKKMGVLKTIVNIAKLDNRRYEGLNMTNMGNEHKNTVEFRISNGTLDPEVIKQNVFLYASIIETARKMTLEPEKMQAKVTELFRTDVDEKTKVKNFLDLVFENPEDRDIYQRRWESVKDAKVFQNVKNKGFAENRFKREEFKAIAKRTPIQMVKEAFSNIKDFVKEKASPILQGPLQDTAEPERG